MITPDGSRRRETVIKKYEKKENKEMVDENPTILIITLNVNEPNIPLKDRLDGSQDYGGHKAALPDPLQGTTYCPCRSQCGPHPITD